jgi:superfamily II DNA or RNA helicase
VIEVENVFSRITETLPEEILDELDATLSFDVLGAWFTSSYQKGWWDGKRHLFSRDAQVFPTGLLGYVREVLRKHNVKIKFIDKRGSIPCGKPLSLKDITLRDYQEEVVKKALKATRGVIQAPTGSGKTEMFAGIIGQLNVQTVVFTHTTNLLYQTQERLERRLRVPIGLIGDGKMKIERINVATMQTIKNKKYKEFLGNVGCLIFDECHHLPCKTLWALQKHCKNAFYRFGFSATPWRDDNSDLLIQASTGRPIIAIKASDLIKKGWLAKPHIFMLHIPRLFSTDGLDYQSIYKTGVVENIYRNELIVQLCNFLAKNKKTILVVVTMIEHGHSLLKALQKKFPEVRATFIRGEIDTQERKQTLEALDKKELDVVFATTVFGEGIDVPSLDCLINVKAMESSVDAFQLLGRVLRKTENKNKAIIIDFYDKARYLYAHAKNRIKIYGTEPEWVLQAISIKELDKIKEVL